MGSVTNQLHAVEIEVGYKSYLESQCLKLRIAKMFLVVNP